MISIQASVRRISNIKISRDMVPDIKEADSMEGSRADIINSLSLSSRNKCRRRKWNNLKLRERSSW